MKKVLLVFTKTEGAYVGGVLSIINHYMSNREMFISQGFDIEHYSYNYSYPQLLKKTPTKVRNLIYGFNQMKALSKKLRCNPVDVVHIHTSREFLFLKDIMLAKHIVKKDHAKVVMTIHVGNYNTVFNRIHFAEKWCLKAMNRYLQKVVFLSRVMQHEFIDRGLESSRSELLYNFHNLTATETLSPKKDGLRLLFVGAIHREKGIMELLRAVKNLADSTISLDICGMLTDSSIKAEFDEIVAVLGRQVKLHGYVSGEEKTQIFKAADVLVLPSYHEGFPLVILEALAAGCALISTEVGTTPEILSKDNVQWVEVANVEDIVQAIQNYRDNPLLLQTVQTANLALANEFTIATNIEKSCRIYDKI